MLYIYIYIYIYIGPHLRLGEEGRVVDVGVERRRKHLDDLLQQGHAHNLLWGSTTGYGRRERLDGLLEERDSHNLLWGCGLRYRASRLTWKVLEPYAE